MSLCNNKKMENLAITLRYKKKEKKTTLVPENFKDLAELFYSYFDEKNNKSFVYSYGNPEIKDKFPIQEDDDDDLFNKNIKEILDNNYKIYIREEDEESENEELDNIFETGNTNPENATICEVKSTLNNEDKRIKNLENELNEIKDQNIELNMKINHFQEDSEKKDNIIEDNENLIIQLNKRIKELESIKSNNSNINKKNELNTIEGFNKELKEISEKYKKEIEQCLEEFQNKINDF